MRSALQYRRRHRVGFDADAAIVTRRGAEPRFERFAGRVEQRSPATHAHRGRRIDNCAQRKRNVLQDDPGLQIARARGSGPIDAADVVAWHVRA